MRALPAATLVWPRGALVDTLAPCASANLRANRETPAARADRSSRGGTITAGTTFPTSNEIARPAAVLRAGTNDKSRWQAALEVLLVTAVFAAAAGWPIPDVNESQYLVKAKRFWNPGFAVNDFFLSEPRASGGSQWADTHLLFYLLAGWPTRWLSLYAYAWLGRAATWLFLAWSWRRLSLAVVAVRWAAVLSAALLVLFNELFQTAGEWVVGGFEAKGPAYGFVFLALAALLRGRWLRACALVGVATAVHVLVGGWTALLLAAVWLGEPDNRADLRQWLGGIALALALALPGLLAAIAIDWQTPRATLDAAARIYVFQRLPHHLLPQDFSPDACMRLAALFGFWWFLASRGPATAANRRLERFVLLSVTVFGLGVALNWLLWPWPGAVAQVMRFYWFRLADAALPIGAALAWPAAVLTWPRANGREHGAEEQFAPLLAAFFAPLLAAGVFLALRGHGVLVAERPRADAPNKVSNHDDWRAAAGWVAAHTPADAVFLTPRASQTFKWYAGRGEVATWKDIPQNAAGIAAWWDRLVDIYGRDETAANHWKVDSLTELTPARLKELGTKYGAGYVVCESQPPLDLPRLYANKSYAVYALDKRNGAQ